jgi:hypothetical protein
VKTSTREQNGILHHIATQQGADQNYIEDGIQLLELASEDHQLFLEEEPEEKRRLLGFWSLPPHGRRESCLPGFVRPLT